MSTSALKWIHLDCFSYLASEPDLSRWELGRKKKNPCSEGDFSLLSADIRQTESKRAYGLDFTAFSPESARRRLMLSKNYFPFTVIVYCLTARFRFIRNEQSAVAVGQVVGDAGRIRGWASADKCAS